MSEETQSSGFSWFLAGLGLGALIGVLYAPKSGKETRDDIAAQAREKSEYLKQRSKEAAEQASALAERAKAQAGQYVDRGKEYVERGRAQWEEFVDKSKGFVGEQTDRVAAAVDAGKEAYNRSATPSSPTQS
ncbi:MAG TPA: YtxH domain-containing protein [Acidisarcina sp.]|nr:YtxH domain-containing protein [Acidisarcina sp.]